MYRAADINFGGRGTQLEPPASTTASSNTSTRTAGVVTLEKNIPGKVQKLIGCETRVWIAVSVTKLSTGKLHKPPPPSPVDLEVARQILSV